MNIINRMTIAMKLSQKSINGRISIWLELLLYTFHYIRQRNNMLTLSFELVFFGILLGHIMSCNPSTHGIKKDEKFYQNGLDKIKIEYIAHASFILTYKHNSLLLDPFADSVWISYSFPRDIEADAIFSTHPHYDHDGGIFRKLKPYWQGKIPFYQDPGSYTIGGFKIQGIKGKHCDPYGKEFDQKNTIFIFEAAGLRIAHWGDNGPITETIAADMSDIDVLMLPIDDSYHILKPEEIDKIITTIPPKIIIPMHYKIAELEPTPGKPKDLETIDQYFSDKTNVTRLEGNSAEFSAELLPDQMRYVVFEHSDKVK